ncbi:MAG: hypothetical protein GX946_04950 [Oligosphaeraceae bacterium]|jgi:hypothetical protein|nr:hypothetical protein [Oligosphaeraceae bacterium]
MKKKLGGERKKITAKNAKDAKDAKNAKDTNYAVFTAYGMTMFSFTRF